MRRIFPGSPAITTACLLMLLAAASAEGQGKFGAGGGLDFGDLGGGGLNGFDPLGGLAPSGELVAFTARFTAAEGETPALVEVTAEVAVGYHIYSVTQPKGGPQATKLELDEVAGVERIGEWVADPKPDVHFDKDLWEDLPLEEHIGRVTWRAPILLPEGVNTESLKISGSVKGQACTETACNPIKAAFVAELAPPGSIEPIPFEQPGVASTTSPASAAGADQRSLSGAEASVSLPWVITLALLGGLILNFMPCVLPVIGLKVLSFAEQAGHDRRRVFAMNLAYVAGLMSVFLLLAGLTAFAGYGWGELNTHNEYKIGIVVLVFAMALSFLGVWEIPIPGFAGGKGANSLQKEGYDGAFFKGVFTTILATPCSGPLLGSAIGYCLGKPTWVTFVVFSAIGLGMAAPYLLIGMFPSLVRFLPKPGQWMETFKQVMGFVLMAAAVYFLSTVSQPLRLPLLVALVAVGFACWLIGSTPLTASASKRAGSWLGGLATCVAVSWAAFTLIGPSKHELPWLPFTPATLEAAKGQGDIVMVDFTADWCPTCKLNSKWAINTEEIARVVADNNVTPILADWTDESEAIKNMLNALGSDSIPFLAIYPADRPDQPILLPDVITEGQLLKALASAGAVKSNPEATAEPQIEIGEARSAATLR